MEKKLGACFTTRVRITLMANALHKAVSICSLQDLVSFAGTCFIDGKSNVAKSFSLRERKIRHEKYMQEANFISRKDMKLVEPKMK